MKRIKKLASILLAMVMVLGMTMTTFAAPEDRKADPGYKLSINTVAGHTYNIWQLATGDVASDGKTLSNIKLGVSVKAGTTVTQIEALKDKTGADLGNAAAELVEFGTEENKVEPFASIKGDGTLLNTTLPGGYYVITDSFTPHTHTDACYGEDGELTCIYANVATTSISRTMVYLIADETITPKTITVELDKKIVDNNQGVTKNEASIGDTITYQLSGLIPDMTGYNSFKYVLVDTASAGLIQNVKVGDKLTGGIGTKNDTTKLVDPLSPEVPVTYEVTSVTRNADGTQEVRLAVTGKDNAYTYKDYSGNYFYVSIDAILTDEAPVVTDKSTNSVKIDFSNNPDHRYEGTPDFGPDDPKGTTPEVTVETVTTSLTLSKVDGTTREALTGAEFKLEGTEVNVGYVTGQKYVENEAGTWYKLADGAYTETAPKEDGTDANKYEPVDPEKGRIKYALEDVKKVGYTFVPMTEAPKDYAGETWYLVNGVYTQKAPSEADAQEYALVGGTPAQTEAQAFVDADGKVVFTGLGQGTYTLTEVTTPNGYNTLNPITFTVSWTEAGGFKVTLADGTDAGIEISDDNQLLASTIPNEKGTLLPSTGGIGTTIFYVVGAVLAIGAGILLVTKKRMSVR